MRATDEAQANAEKGACKQGMASRWPWALRNKGEKGDNMRQPGARSQEENAWAATAPTQNNRKPQSRADAVMDPLGASKRKLTQIMHGKQAECKTAFFWHIRFLKWWLTT